MVVQNSSPRILRLGVDSNPNRDDSPSILAADHTARIQSEFIYSAHHLSLVVANETQ